MPADDEYKIPINRGRLKIKGVEDHGRIKKNKKSKRKEATRSSSSTRSEKQQSDQFAEAANDGQDDQKKLEEPRHTGDDKDTDPLKGKTKAEISYEITKKKRAEHRLRMEGVKTHKERVEDFNRYLSTLSEHHDMPKIGPG